MSEFKEIEFKNVLTEEEYEKLVKYFKLTDQDCFEQLNIYFDTKDLELHKKKIALRTRIKNDAIELTLKQKTSTCMLETTDLITFSDLDILLLNHTLPKGEVLSKLETLNIYESLYEIARLKTIRYEFEYLDNLIALDKSLYYGFVDYEIELETKDYDYGKSVFLKLLSIFNITRNKPKNKIERAFQYKKSSDKSET
ncbi:MAG TPA: CYTH domain-containing protein [Haloplasmataceae bacterium]